jgi:biopolymer transport protein ExbD
MKQLSKSPIRLDMTPMVDIGFLLLMAFTMINFMQKPQAMSLQIPSLPNESEKVIVCGGGSSSKVLTLSLAENNKLYWYRGRDIQVDSIDFSIPANLRSVFENEKSKVKNKWGTDTVMIVLIKPMKKATFKNIVDVMDEMAISNIKKYVLMNFTTQDSILLWQGEQP